jgi:hypothetical protein
LPPKNETKAPFAIKDCALDAIGTGVRAYTLRELKDNLRTIHPGSIYYHFWGGLLRPRFDDREYNNDFAIWAHHPQGLHDEPLAERLGVIDPTDFKDLEELRGELVEVMEERLEESERLLRQHADEPFLFNRSQIVVFNTNRTIERPEELASRVPHLSVSSVFYHFIDARRRTPVSTDDFRAWLEGFGGEYEELCARLSGIDPYFISLAHLRQILTTVFQGYFGGAEG